MKKLILGIALASTSLLPLVSYGQKNVTQKAKMAFQKAYLNVHSLKRENEDGNFEGSWKEGGVDQSVVFSPSGHFVASETGINPAQLPKPALAYLSMHKITARSASINKDNKDVTTYEADIKGEGCLFDEPGNFLRITKGD